MSTGQNRTRHADLTLGIDGLLVSVLTGLPRLPGAACSGRWSLFEPPRDDERRDDVNERHDAAEAVCAGCPALDACRDWAQDEPDDGSVVAGRSSAPYRGRTHSEVA